MIHKDALPDDISDGIVKVSELLREGKKHKAMRKLRVLRKRCPDNWHFRLMAFGLSYKADYLDDALDDARFLAENARSNEDKLNLAECLIRMNRYEEAEGVLSECSDLSGKSARYHFLLGSLKHRKGDIPSANEEFTRVFSAERKKGEWSYRMNAHLLLARNFLDEGRIEDAKREARLAVREAEDPEILAEAVVAMDSPIIIYEVAAEVVGTKKGPLDKNTREFIEALRLSADAEESDIIEWLKEGRPQH